MNDILLQMGQYLVYNFCLIVSFAGIDQHLCESMTG